MRRIGYSLAALALLGALTALVATTTAGEKGGTAKAPYVHGVLFYLKKDAPKSAASDIIADCHTLLSKIPTVRSVRAGRPAEKGTPKVGQRDYDVGLLVLFDNDDGLQTYISHKMHDQFLARNGKYIERVVVVDFLDQKK